MKKALKILRILFAVALVVWVQILFFFHYPEIQLVFLTPGVTLLSYSIIRDELYTNPSFRFFKGR